MKNYELIWRALENIEYGALTITLPQGIIKKFSGGKNGPTAEVKIKNNEVINSIISGGDIAFGEAYIDDLWSSNNLADFLTFLTLNSHALESFFHARKFKALLLFLRSFFTKNTKSGSKKNIQSHYDLGNNFYELWLDESMTYSSAIFNNDNISLLEAQKKKYKNILSKLNHGTILEIGCGWGGFAKEAAAEGYQINCLTISEKQKSYATQHIGKIDLKNLVNVKFQDYREEKGIYDNVVSIEMFEAVGFEYWKKYFQTIQNCLKSNGKALLQIITIDENVFENYKNRVDFIQKHIFPGGILPSKTIIRDLAKSYGFAIKSEFAFGFDYGKTLEIWLKNFDEKYPAVKKLGFSDHFIRKWRFYLCYCIAGFRAKRTDVVQFELIKL
jgi:cyclopropane-fatty-acyl-phospholipid synthase